jgi:hypothetical protein
LDHSPPRSLLRHRVAGIVHRRFRLPRGSTSPPSWDRGRRSEWTQAAVGPRSFAIGSCSSPGNENPGRHDLGRGSLLPPKDVPLVHRYDMTSISSGMEIPVDQCFEELVREGGEKLNSDLALLKPSLINRNNRSLHPLARKNTRRAQPNRRLLRPIRKACRLDHATVLRYVDDSTGGT